MRPQRGTHLAASSGGALLAGCTALALLVGCTDAPALAPPGTQPVPAGKLQLVAFDSCADALAGLKTAAKAYVGPWGFGDGRRLALDASEGRDASAGQESAADRAPAEAAAPGGPGFSAPGAGDPGAPDHSGTNTHEAGVDEPDLVKTDGRRIVTVIGGMLRVIDAASRRITGTLRLHRDTKAYRWQDASLLLHNDRALVLIPQDGPHLRMPTVDGPAGAGDVPPADGTPAAIAGPRLLLVDLAGPPRLLAEYRVDGSLVDARQVGATARIVVRSAPRLDFRYDPDRTDAERVAANRRVIDQAGIEAWLPRYEVTSGAVTTRGQVDCDRLIRPETYSGASLVTVLSFDLAAPATGPAPLGDGDPLTVVADGDTVYSNGARLYIASDHRWRLLPSLVSGRDMPNPNDQVTEIYQFDTSRPGRPRYVTATSVPGWLLNQYALSEWAGHLRVATTLGRTWGERPDSDSAVYVLRADGQTLTETGRVTGLGRGEQIYAVRFTGDVGYVVTFRQTDPLYTLDLRDPAAPRAAGELKVTGYSAYLHPIGDGRLLGIGQEASVQGRIQGTQVSLFDVSDLARPTRLAQHHVADGHSEAEFDPHAFLYWPRTRLLVVPLTWYGKPTLDRRRPTSPQTGALGLRVGDRELTEIGLVDHREAAKSAEEFLTIRRSLVVDGVLWTISDRAAKATDLDSLRTLGLVRLDT